MLPQPRRETGRQAAGERKLPGGEGNLETQRERGVRGGLEQRKPERGRGWPGPDRSAGRYGTFFFSRLRSFLSITPRICFMASVCTELVLPPAATTAWGGAAAGAASLPAGTGPTLPLLLAIVLLVAEGISTGEKWRAR